jgi:DNA-binding LacI/PurR family transcriptional regulator
MRSVTSLTVAQAAGVSPATVSLVMNDRRDIVLSEATRERVRAVAKRMGYRPSYIARSLVRGRTQTVGVILPSLASSFVSQIAEGVQAAAWERDHRVLLSHTRHDPEIEARQLALLLEHQVDGVVIVTGERTLGELPARLDTLANARVPAVVVDEASVADRVDCVVSDDEQGARMAVEHLLRLGHRRIALLGAGNITSSARARLAGYRQALEGAGIRFDASLVCGRTYLQDDGASLLGTLLALPTPPTAIVAANDRRLAEGLPWLSTRGIRVPQDLALVGYANYDFAAYLGLTSVDQHPQALGLLAMDRLLRRIDQPRLKPRLFKEVPELVVRQSSGRAGPPEEPPTT